MTRKEQQIERIKRYETMLNEVKEALQRADIAVEAYKEARPKLRKLEKYYTGSTWKNDFSASEEGKLPKELPCGVLSEDGINDVLDEELELLKKIRGLLK